MPINTHFVRFGRASNIPKLDVAYCAVVVVYCMVSGAVVVYVIFTRIAMHSVIKFNPLSYGGNIFLLYPTQNSYFNNSTRHTIQGLALEQQPALN